jgi:hypothetical protein
MATSLIEAAHKLASYLTAARERIDAAAAAEANGRTWRFLADHLS